MSAPPYWGQLPPPRVDRSHSLQREGGTNHLSLDTKMAGDRSSQQSTTQSQRRQNRDSSQTNPLTVSTESPFASPTASDFSGGLAPRPPSFPTGTSEAAYNNDYLEKRWRRQTREQESFDAPSPAPPPAAPDAPRAAPPVSYRDPYSNGTSSIYKPPTRSRSARRSEGPISPSGAVPEEYHRSHPQEPYRSEGTDRGRVQDTETGTENPAVSRRRNRRNKSEQLGIPPRRGSISETDARRRREWAPDRSPLQRLELTLDSITKEEKRARVEEAELLSREEKARRGGERANQNSVRFRNRPVAKGSEPTGQPGTQTSPEAGLEPKPSVKQKDQLQRSGTGDKQKTVGFSAAPSANLEGGLEYQSKQDSGLSSQQATQTTPQRGPSFRDRSLIPGPVRTTADLGRSGSNKIRKDPPGDTRLHRQVEAETQYPQVTARRQSTSDRHQPYSNTAGPSRDTAFRSHPQAIPGQELPIFSHEVTRAPANNRDVAYIDDMNPKPQRRGTLSKSERMTGEKLPAQMSRSMDPQNDVQTKLVTVDGIQYAVATKPTEGSNNTEATRKNPSSQEERHRLSNLFHRNHESQNEQGVYVPSRRFDEWKKGGIALLSGALLDLDVDDNRSEADKDKAWWEAGHTGTRRRSSTKQRKAEAYDGEYDDRGMAEISHKKSHKEECQVCVAERTEIAAVTHVRSPKRSKTHRRPRRAKTPQQATQNETLQFPPKTPSHLSRSHSQPELVPYLTLRKTHSLTCTMRPIRVRPDIAPTRFKPPLFLKTGPLLRYCGLRQEPRSRPDQTKREIWRGSIMIVTEDIHSSYELAPTLRIFLQPTDLLPPPPSQVDGEIEELAPEYVDPLAGLPKLGRDGRTLYVRPIDHLEEIKDLSREESEAGLYEMHPSSVDGATDARPSPQKPRYDGEKAGKYKEVRGFRLHAEQGVTFWRFNIEIELRDKQQRIAYRINRGPATTFWVPPRNQPMNIMFYSCNGFSYGVDSNPFCGPDPMWRDVLNTHQTRPFHVMLGGGDQLYNDAVMYDTTLYREWWNIKDDHHKEKCPFTPQMQTELETFYLDRYCMWFSQGLFSLAVSQIPMINIFDDHDIIDGFGSYTDDYMRCPVFSGLGAIAFKYYMLFQHQSSIDEGEETEPSWILGAQPGPYIKELSRSVFTKLGRSIAFIGLDCRTERMNDEILSAETYYKVFARLEKELVKGETKHLIVMVGIPMAYPRMVWLENILTSRAIEPIKFLGRAGLLGKGLLNHMDGGVEILDDLDDHWTAKHHKDERNWLIQELQDLAAEKSVRITILGGDVHLGAVGQFYSKPKLGIPKDQDFRYMPNIISSAIVNVPPPDTLADILNRRNKVHHLDQDTDEDMIPIFTHDVNGKPRRNQRLLNRRNWCSIRQYDPEWSPPPTPQTDGTASPPKRGLLRRASTSRGPSYRSDAAPRDRPPISSAGFFSRHRSNSRPGSRDSARPGSVKRTLSLTRAGSLFRRNSRKPKQHQDGINGYNSESDNDEDLSDNRPGRSGIRGGSGGRDEDEENYFPSVAAPQGRAPENPIINASTSIAGAAPRPGIAGGQFRRVPTSMSQKQLKRGGDQSINLEGGLDICLNMEVNSKDPAGITMPYRLLVPALFYDEEDPYESVPSGTASNRWSFLGRSKSRRDIE